jgi:GxxExxY protein
MSNELTHEIIGSAIEVHRQLGPGLLESIYEECLLAELTQRGLATENQYPIPVTYKGRQLNSVYRCDLLVQNTVIVELKTVDKIAEIHKAQLLTYLKVTGLRFGLLLNFNVPTMRQGIVRMLNQ